jgi:lysozyme
MSRTISEKGLSFIALHEGFRSNIYKDAAGLPTIGFGHLLLEGEAEKFKNGITKEQGKELLKSDIAEAERYVNSFVKVSLTQSQFDALVSFVFNIGAGNFRKSTLLRKLNESDYDGASSEFLRWVRAGGKVLLGLQRRRAAERKMFLS